MKELRLYAKMAEREMSMISLMWGLKFSNFEFNDGLCNHINDADNYINEKKYNTDTK
jgi:hypothetical protein